MGTSGGSGPSARRPAALRKFGQIALNWIVLAAIVIGVGFFLRSRAHRQLAPQAETDEAPARLSEAFADTLELDPQTVQSMHVQAVPVRPAPPTAPLKMLGSLYLEGNRYVHVQTRFTGQVVEVGEIRDENDRLRPLKPGDKVEQGEVLAKLWSKEVGEKKSDLVDAISKLYLHGNVLKRLQSLSQGAIPLARLQEAERDYAADKIEIERLKRTLRSWQIQEEELQAIQAEAERIIQESLAKDPSTPARGSAPATAHPGPMRPSEQLALDRTWAELDIVAPMAGVILEKNFTVGDIVDTTHDMFKIADLSRLGVMANVYEEDLPRLVALPVEDRRWEVELLAEPGLPPRKGRFESIGNVIDTTQHTAVVKGWLDNPDGQLRVGQFVTATVELPNRPGLVLVPTSSLIDDGSRTYVFVSHDREKTILTRREIRISRRGVVMALVESHPKINPSSDSRPQPIEEGELVVSSGAIELAGAYHMLATQSANVMVKAEPRSDETESRQ